VRFHAASASLQHLDVQSVLDLAGTARLHLGTATLSLHRTLHIDC
jgi:hypothetical protein